MDISDYVYLIAGLAILVGMVVIGIVLSRLYRRAERNKAFVRTGLGGQKVIMDGGAVVLPVFHTIIEVNMETMRLTVTRRAKEALITKDPLRVDLVAEFYVRVSRTGVPDAAATLGNNTFNLEALKTLVEPKAVDALRAVAATMELKQLHENRTQFSQQVLETVKPELAKNGLELESVSLTHLDQTSHEHLDPNNSFDAQGLRILSQITETQRQQRNEIEATTRVAIEQRNQAAAKQSFEIARDQEFARLDQEKEIAFQTAEQETAVAERRAEARRQAEEARIAADQTIQAAEIASQRTIKTAEIDRDRAIQVAEIARTREIETARIEQERSVATANVERQQAIDIAKQQSLVAVAEKAAETAEAERLANNARAEAVKSEEQVNTNRQTAVAERTAAIAVIEARQEAQQQAVGITVAAEAEREAAENRAAAIRTSAEAEAGRVRMAAQADAEAVEMRAAADAKRYATETAYIRDKNEAEGALPANILEFRLNEAKVRMIPEAIAATVKPIESIDAFRILKVEGLNGILPAGDGAAANGGGGGGLVDDVVRGVLRYRLNAPILEEIAAELGQKGVSPEALLASLSTALRNGNGLAEIDGRRADDQHSLPAAAE